MQTKKMWIAEHPEDAYTNEVSFVGPGPEPVDLYSDTVGTNELCKWKEYVCIPVEY